MPKIMDYISFESNDKSYLEIKAKFDYMNFLYPELPSNNWLKIHHKPMIRNAKSVRAKRKRDRYKYYKKYIEPHVFEILASVIDNQLSFLSCENFITNFVDVKNFNIGEKAE